MSKPTPLTDHERALVAPLLADGCSFREIARTTGVGRERLSATYPGRGWTYAEAGAFRAATSDYKAERWDR